MSIILPTGHGTYPPGPFIVQTRKCQNITNEQRLTAHPLRMRTAGEIMLTDNPSYRIRSLRNEYNCMGMIFASRRTWIDPDEFYSILKDDDYRLVDNLSEAEIGDVVSYKCFNQLKIFHVGIISLIKPNIKNGEYFVEVLSQFGADGEYFHPLNELPKSMLESEIINNGWVEKIWTESKK